EVTLSGEVCEETGMVFDLKELKKLTTQEILKKVDHKNLNVDVDFLEGIIPTAENLAIKFWEVLEPKISKGRLHEIKLYESERNYVVYRGGCL
ncbi:MAG: 6-carboxytetrahydropterin synthase, partial [Nitrospina sp.]|nr:6-carboxytetrahydropterin synthase [Nitrospina sp.]